MVLRDLLYCVSSFCPIKIYKSYKATQTIYEGRSDEILSKIKKQHEEVQVSGIGIYYNIDHENGIWMVLEESEEE